MENRILKYFQQVLINITQTIIESVNTGSVIGLFLSLFSSDNNTTSFLGVFPLVFSHLPFSFSPSHQFACVKRKRGDN